MISLAMLVAKNLVVVVSGNEPLNPVPLLKKLIRNPVKFREKNSKGHTDLMWL